MDTDTDMSPLHHRYITDTSTTPSPTFGESCDTISTSPRHLPKPNPASPPKTPISVVFTRGTGLDNVVGHGQGYAESPWWERCVGEQREFDDDDALRERIERKSRQVGPFSLLSPPLLLSSLPSSPPLLLSSSPPLLPSSSPAVTCLLVLALFAC